MRNVPPFTPLVRAIRVLGLGALLGTASCAQVLGLSEFEDCDEDSCSGLLWAKSFENGDVVFPTSARLDSEGNILLSGVFRGTVDFGGDPLISSGMDVFLAKLRPDGSHVFSRWFSVEDSDGLFASHLSILPDDSVVLSGIYRQAIDLGDGEPLTASRPDGHGAFVARFLPDGELLWRRDLSTGTGKAFALDVAAVPGGDVVLVGSFEGEVNLGSSTMTTAVRDAFIAKLDGETGKAQWSRQLGDSQDTTTTATIDATAVAVDRDGSIFVGGRFTGSIMSAFVERQFESPSGAGAFLFKIVATGDADWVSFFQGEGDALVSDIDVDARGNVVAAGAFAGAISIRARGAIGAHQTSGSTDSDGLLVKLSSAGNHVWSLRFGDESPQFGESWNFVPGNFIGGPRVAVDADGNVVLGTGIAGVVDFGGGPLGGRQDSDWTMAKLSAGGEYLWSRRLGDAATGQSIIGIDTDPVTNAIVAVGFNDGTLDFGAGITIGKSGEVGTVIAKMDLERLGK
ncbi:SBBP repeat-containing protein [Sorangium sp. So ce1024]|uniref:SBBP repeat-containing protein n=1 Tax=unclassified Sorangium TaxID=2621164 RepID=UPI003F058A02